MHATLDLWQAIDWVVEVLDVRATANRMPSDVVAYLAAIQVGCAGPGRRGVAACRGNCMLSPL